MSLSAALNIAQSALATNAGLSALVSRNIAGVNDTSYSRKLGSIVTLENGASSRLSVTRATDTALYNTLLSSTADAAASSAAASGLDQLEQTVTLTASDTTATKANTGNAPATLLAKLTDALSQYAASPGDASLGQVAISAARSLVGSLNEATSTVSAVRAQADSDLATTVSDMNSLLGQFKTVNDAIVKGTAGGADTTDLQDQRDQLLVSLSSDIGITTSADGNGGLSIYTDSGVTLFQGLPRSVSFSATPIYSAGTVGNAVQIDGVAVTGPNAAMTAKSGKIAGLSQLRDTTTVAYQNQLDQIASGLVNSFAEHDQTGGTAPTVAGLFTYAGGPALPVASATGLAGTISVSANVDPAQGGVLTRLRDGGIGAPGNPAYVANTTGATGYATRINAMLASLNTTQSFDPASGGAAAGTLGQFATSSVSWLEAQRQSATDTSTAKSALATQAGSALNSTTGVNLDEQLSRMLDLEHSYQSSAELISTVNGMFSALFGALN